MFRTPRTWLGLTTAVLISAILATPGRPQQPSAPVPAANPARAAVTGAPAAVEVARKAPEPAEAPPLADPFPIRRVFVTADRWATLLPQVQKGALVRLPREEFEAKVRAAAAAVERDPPQLVEARYRAVFGEGGLTGTASWTIRSAAATPRFMPVEPLHVAVGRGEWVGGGPAVLVRTDPSLATAAPQLLVDGSGDRPLSLHWSARGVEEPAADRFDLGFPASSVATFELDLPADRVPSVTLPNQFLSGPTPAADPTRRLWRVVFGGQSRVELAVRRPAGQGQPGPLVRVRKRLTKYVVTPGMAACTYEFDLESTRDAGAWQFVADPGLRVTEVSGSGRLNWEIEPAAKPGGPTRLRVTSLDGSTTDKVTVGGYAAIPPGGGWRGPQVRVAGAIQGGDEIQYRLGPDVKFLGFDPGDYRVESTAAAGREFVASFTGVPLAATAEPTAERRPPALRARAADAEYATTRADHVWRVSNEAVRLSANLSMDVVRGPVVQIPLVVPPGYAVESVALSTGNPAAAADAGQTDSGLLWLPQANNRLHLTPSRPIPTGQAVRLQVELRGKSKPPSSTAGGMLPPLLFPRVEVLNAPEQDGTFTIEVGPEFRAWTTPALSSQPTGEWVFRYRGRSPEGLLHLSPVQALGTVSRETEVSVLPGEVITQTTLRLRSDRGLTGTHLLYAPRPAAETWTFKSDHGSIRPVTGGELIRWSGVMPAGSGWSALAGVGLSTGVRGSWWWFEASRGGGPDEATVVAVARRAGPTDGTGSVDAPVPSVVGLRQSATTVTATSFLAGRYAVVPGSTGGFPTVAKLIRETTPLSVGSGAEQFHDLTLVNRVSFDGRVSCLLSGRIRSGGGATVRLDLPAGAAVKGVTMNGKHVPFVDEESPAAADFHGLRLPVPAVPPDGLGLEVRYELPAAGWESAPRPVRTFVSPPPRLAGQDLGARVTWALPPEFRAWSSLAPGVSRDADPTRCVAVSRSFLAAAGFVLAALVLGAVIGVAGRVPPRLLVGAVLLVAGALGVAAQTLPEGWEAALCPPLIAALLVVAFLHVRTRGERGGPANAGGDPAPARLSSTRALVRTAAVLALLGGASRAQAPDPVTVYLVPANGGDAGRLAAYVPADGVKRLDDLAGSPVPPVLLASAEYDGSADERDAGVFTAKYQLLVTREGSHPFSLPLSGVRLEGLTVDGRAAFPESSRPDRYALTVAGAGKHEVVAKFSVGAVTTGIEHEVRFTVPDVPVGLVRFHVPGDSSQIDVPTRRGAQTVTRGGRLQVAADHGGGRTLAVRWRAGTPSGSATATVREVGVWDLTETTDTLTAAFVYRVDGRPSNRFAIEIPEGTEPLAPVVRAGGLLSLSDKLPLRSWHVTDKGNGWRTVDLVLQTPVEGRLVVVLELLSRRTTTARPVLRFPRAARVAQSEAYYGLRTSGVAIDARAAEGVIDFSPENIAREFAAIPELQLGSRPLTRGFQRAGAGDAEVRPTLSHAGSRLGGSSEVTWTVGPRIDAAGVLSVSRAGPPETAASPAARPGLSVVEFDLPPAVALQDVRTPDMLAWNRTGSRVQVWLKKPTAAATVQWTGTLAGSSALGAKPLPDAATLELPFAKLPGANTPQTTVRVRTLSGWAAEAVPQQGMTATGDGDSSNELGYRLDPSAAAPKFEIFRAPPGTRGRLLETVERSGQGVGYRARVSVPLPLHRPGHFTLKLEGIPDGASVKVQGPVEARVRQAGSGPGGRAWEVFTPKEFASPLVLELTAQLPLPATLPDVAVVFGGPPIPWGERAAAVRDPALLPDHPLAGWRPLNATEHDRLRATWKGHHEANPEAVVWLATAPDADRLKLAPPAAKPPEGAPSAPAAPAAVGGASEAAPTVSASSSERRHVATGAWVVGWLLLVLVVVRGGSRWWPEGWVLCGLLAAAVLGVEAWESAAFWGLAAVGLLARFGGVLGQSLRGVMR